MKIYVWVKGNMEGHRRWTQELASVKFPFLWKKGEKKGLMRMGVRPIIIYELGFPEDQLEEALSMIGISTDGSYILNRYPIIKKVTSFLRRVLKLKPVPKPKKILEHMQPQQIDKAVAVVPIGMKKDVFNDEGQEQL